MVEFRINCCTGVVTVTCEREIAVTTFEKLLRGFEGSTYTVHCDNKAIIAGAMDINDIDALEDYLR